MGMSAVSAVDIEKERYLARAVLDFFGPVHVGGILRAMALAPIHVDASYIDGPGGFFERHGIFSGGIPDRAATEKIRKTAFGWRNPVSRRHFLLACDAFFTDVLGRPLGRLLAGLPGASFSKPFVVREAECFPLIKADPMFFDGHDWQVEMSLSFNAGDLTPVIRDIAALACEDILARAFAVSWVGAFADVVENFMALPWRKSWIADVTMFPEDVPVENIGLAVDGILAVDRDLFFVLTGEMAKSFIPLEHGVFIRPCDSGEGMFELFEFAGGEESRKTRRIAFLSGSGSGMSVCASGKVPVDGGRLS